MLFQSSIEHLPIPDNSVDLIFTDPPYPKEYLQCYNWLAKEAMRVLKPGKFVIAMCGEPYLNQIYRFFDDAGLNYWFEIYHYSNHGIPTIYPRHICAPIKPLLVYVKGEGAPPRHNIAGMFSGHWKDKRYHHWGQDVDSARYYISCFSNENDLVLGPFIGGGTTIIACKLANRRWIASDVDPNAIDIVKARLNETSIFKQGEIFYEKGA